MFVKLLEINLFLFYSTKYERKMKENIYKTYITIKLLYDKINLMKDLYGGNYMEEVLRLTNVNKSFGEHHVLHDVSFAAGRGELIGYIGPNGSAGV